MVSIVNYNIIYFIFRCILTPPYYSCVSGSADSQILLSVDVTSNAIQIISKPLSQYIPRLESEATLRPLDGNSVLPGFIVNDQFVAVIKNSDFKLLDIRLNDMSASAALIESSGELLLVQTWTDEANVSMVVDHFLTALFV